MPMPGSFDARTIPPQQALDKHPAGMFDAQITNTEIKPNSNNDGGRFVVTFATPVGQIQNGYNLWYAAPNDGQSKSMEIAHKQLSALCHATGIFNLGWENDGAALRGARCRIEVAPQAKNPEYVEIRKVFDASGNEPGKPAMQPAAGQQGGNAGWGGPQPAQQPQAPVQPQQPQPAAPAWGQTQQPAPQAAQQPGWQQGPAPAAAAPWGAPNR